MSTHILLVGDESPHIASHGRIPGILAALGAEHTWVPTDRVDPAGLAAADGVWLVPGSPYASEAGALTAVRVAISVCRRAGNGFTATSAWLRAPTRSSSSEDWSCPAATVRVRSGLSR
ncbi:MAG: hypothetical protein V9G19_09600 [Tetrasphaera sp.]